MSSNSGLLTQALAVGVGAACGGLLRWGTGLWLNARWAGFPLGTLVVNCVGGALIGAALAWFERWPDELWRALWVTGVLGGLTTFSAFSVESLLLLQRGHFALAAGHTLAHVLGALGCAALGYRAAQALLV
ncbi:MAG: fluoride efflux transporter CrcB [Burkholderiaceae bacterium]